MSRYSNKQILCIMCIIETMNKHNIKTRDIEAGFAVYNKDKEVKK